jgi:hypothetical protein
MHSWSKDDISAFLQTGQPLLTHVDFPAGFSPPFEWSKVKVKVSVNQQDAQMEVLASRLAECKSEVWDELLFESVSLWYMNTCSTEMLWWTAALHGIDWSPYSSKRELMEYLLAAQLLPLAVMQIAAYSEAWDRLSDEDQEAVSDQAWAPLPVLVRPAAVLDDTGELRRDLNDSEEEEHVSIPLSAGDENLLASLLARKRKASGDPGPVGGPSDGIGSSRLLAEVLQKIGDKLAVVPKKKVKLSPYEHLIKCARKAIASAKFFEISSLNAGHLDHLKLLTISASSSQKVKVNSFTVSAEKSGDYKGKIDFSNVQRWDLFKSGFPMWVSLMLEDSGAKLLASDRLLWFSLLDRFDASDAKKIEFARHFHHKHVETISWATAFESDSALLLRMVARDSSSFNPRLERNHGGDRRGRNRDSGGRGRGGHGGFMDGKSRGGRGGGSGRGHGRGAGSASKKTCHSRMKLDKGQCTYPKCRFSHLCVCCGADHAATACTAWDPAKAAAALSRQGD